MPLTRSICLPCRLRLLSSLHASSHSFRRNAWAVAAAHAHTRPSFVPKTPSPPQRRAASTQHIPPDGDSKDVNLEATLAAEHGRPDYEPQESLQEEQEETTVQLSSEQLIELARSQAGPEAVAQAARQRFGDRLPQDALKDDEYRVYERLYGTPLAWTPEHESELEQQEVFEDDGEDVLLREGEDGSLEAIEYEREVNDDYEKEEEVQEDIVGRRKSLNAVDAQLRADIEAALAQEEEPLEETGGGRDAAEDMDVDAEPSNVIDPTGQPALRTHPFTLAARAGTEPATVQLPKSEITLPVAAMLSEVPNRHLREAAEKALGGPGLPYSTGTPRISRTKPQKPIPLSAYQSRMSPIEADVFIGALMPGLYASLMSVIVESRRNMGSDWLSSLMKKEEGPSILDAGAGGAGVLAWREVLKAEWARLSEEQPALDIHPDEAPLGKALVLTSSDTLRGRAKLLLENTTFLPRLPDYVHISPKDAPASHSPSEDGEAMPHGRKQFDIIVAPHSLWPLAEEWQRRQHIQNLWAMLNPDGGVLILLEKGVPRGFEVLAAAREYLLKDLFANESSAAQANVERHADSDRNGGDYAPKHLRTRHRHASPGAILAPCTTHDKCPMYRKPGISRQRKDYCRFSQRYARPSYHQTILGAKSRNHEDVEFSYVSVVRGKRPEEIGRVAGADGALRKRIMGKAATDRAAQGYDTGDGDLILDSGRGVQTPVTAGRGTHHNAESASTDNSNTSDSQADGNVLTTPPPSTPAPHPLTLPRLILPPLKRPGHILMDVCTPAGTLERWSIPRSFSRQAYRDARKSIWGDTWPLGAASRTGRRLRVGKGMVMDGGVFQGKDEDLGEIEDPEVEAMAAKKQTKLRGRAKARTRKREEKKAMAMAEEERKAAKNRPAGEDQEDVD